MKNRELAIPLLAGGLPLNITSRDLGGIRRARELPKLDSGEKL